MSRLEVQESVWANIGTILQNNGAAGSKGARQANNLEQEQQRWQAVIDGWLNKWAQDPSQLEDEGIVPPSREVIQLSCQRAADLCEAGLPGPIGSPKHHRTGPRGKMETLPAALGFRMPAEWEAHEATWIAWPHRRDDWPGKFAAIPWVYAEIVRHLHHSEPVRILVNDARAEKRARQVLRRAAIDFNRVEFFVVPTDRVWVRDSGPIFVADNRGAVALTDWKFNAWAKYPDGQKDDAVPGRLATVLGLPAWQPLLARRRIVLEGGSIDVNGAGLLLTTEQCLLDSVQARNPGLQRHELESLFADYLGIEKVLWLGRGIAGDDTHGHVDDLARFVDARTIVTVVEADTTDLNYEPLQENLHRLRGMTDQHGQPLKIVPLPMPEPVWFNGQRLPASYANFYIANDRVLVPTFNDPHDRRALDILSELFPKRTVVGVHAVDLVWGLGTLHCLTQQQPASQALDKS
jgi:agmatine deiminase